MTPGNILADFITSDFRFECGDDEGIGSPFAGEDFGVDRRPH
jgi:hypothetical protein